MRALRSALPIVLATLPACSFTVHEHFAWSSKSAMGLLDATGTEEIVLACPSEATALTATLSVHCRGGEMRVQLTDPAGAVCCAETLRGGERQCTLQWPSQGGDWRCRLVLTGFRGDYRVELAAHDEPLLEVKAEITSIEAR